MPSRLLNIGKCLEKFYYVSYFLFIKIVYTTTKLFSHQFEQLHFFPIPTFDKQTKSKAAKLAFRKISVNNQTNLIKSLNLETRVFSFLLLENEINERFISFRVDLQKTRSVIGVTDRV